MIIEEKPFSSTYYRLASCGLQRMEDRHADVIGRTLACMDPWRRMGYTATGLFRYLIRNDPSQYRYSIVLAEEIAGLVCVRYPWLRGPYIELLAVFSPYQGRHFGREVIGWAMNEMMQIAGNVWATVSSFNTPARLFYQNNGFVEIAELPELVNSGFNEILLRKKCA
jgi:ribosomal protein S18 acetylase RimI-like enzyme